VCQKKTNKKEKREESHVRVYEIVFREESEKVSMKKNRKKRPHHGQIYLCLCFFTFIVRVNPFSSFLLVFEGPPHTVCFVFRPCLNLICSYFCMCIYVKIDKKVSPFIHYSQLFPKPSFLHPFLLFPSIVLRQHVAAKIPPAPPPSWSPRPPPTSVWCT